jgi:hypothetical protein
MRRLEVQFSSTQIVSQLDTWKCARVREAVACRLWLYNFH